MEDVGLGRGGEELEGVGESLGGNRLGRRGRLQFKKEDLTKESHF